MAKIKEDRQPLAKAEKESEIAAEANLEAQAAEDFGQLVDEEQLEAGAIEKGAKTESEISAEEVAVHTDNQTAQEVNTIKISNPATKITKITHRSRKYLKARGKVDSSKLYNLKQALSLARETSYSKFDGSLELHVRLIVKAKGGSESIRGLIQLPHGTGKIVKAAILDDDLIEKIVKDKQTEYDILIAPKTLAPKLAKIAKILGPQGKMPSPKAGTITDNPEETLASIKGGRIEYKADTFGIVHQLIGKVSWDDQNILENIEALLAILPKTRISSIAIASTMGPAVKIDPSTL